ncbi:hypothetical protein [Paenibacillus tarimensis]|uniref:hypothetical protein n=1 Tax=Paenibacillus tarimensis TaxID=416012 RepID=UPI001F46FF2C|nr:hypothetical protein [Paenibacillus tarimensis]MCF2942447.1 hypothetical protein [Paenibacillus tarimensis]
MNLGNAADWVIMVVAGSFLAVWLFRSFYAWLHEPSGSRVVLLGDGEELAPDDENVKFLERSGFEVVSGKHRIPVTISLDGEKLKTRLYVDYVAERDGLTYLVKTARDRMPYEWTGSGLRDRLFMYALLVPGTEGIIIMDARDKWIRTLTFRITEQG